MSQRELKEAIQSARAGMTPAEKAVVTRRKNKKAREEKYQEEKRVRNTVVNTLLGILENDRASISQKLEASIVLKDITGEGGGA